MRLSSFFRHCETDFFPIFFIVPPSIFDILQQNGCSKNPKASPLLHFLALCDLPETSKKIRKLFFSIFSFLRAFVVSSCRKSGFRFRVFLSLRYGADLGRSRLVYICHIWVRVGGYIVFQNSLFILYIQKRNLKKE